jgi:hypothetical protein
METMQKAKEKGERPRTARATIVFIQNSFYERDRFNDSKLSE